MVTETDFATLSRLSEVGPVCWVEFHPLARQDDVLLVALKISYVLDPKIQPFPKMSHVDTDNIKVDRKKGEEDELICIRHIMNTLSDQHYDVFTSMKSPGEICKALEFKDKTRKSK